MTGIPECKKLMKRINDLETEVKSLEIAKRNTDFLSNMLLIANKHSFTKMLLEDYVSEIKEYTKWQAVGIRMLDEEGNIPYHVYTGFKSAFYEIECPLSIKRDMCLCINIIKGRVVAQKNLCTDAGSIFINSTSKFYNALSSVERTRNRNVCNEYGYESVILIPIRSGKEILGLIHLADEREGLASIDLVEILEKAAVILGIKMTRINFEDLHKGSVELNQNLIKTMNDGILVVDKSGFVTFINERVLELIGYESDEVLHHKYSDFVAEDSFDLFQRQFAARMKGERGLYEVVFKCKGGKRITVSISSSPILDEKGEINGSIAVITDITNLKETERALKSSEERYRNLIETMNHGLTISDGELRIIHANRSFGTMMDYSTDEIIGRPQTDFVAEEKFEAFMAQIVNRKKGIAGFYELLLKKKDGTRLPVLISASPFLDAGGKYIGSFAIFTDLTEMKRVEKALEKAGKEKEIRNDIAEIFFTVSGNEMYGKVLQLILDSMNCKFGILGYMNEADEIICPSLVIDGEDKYKAEGRNIVFPDKSWKNGIWTKAISEKKSFYSNKRQTLPGGHFLVKSILCSPIIYAGETIGIIILANKKGAFTVQDRRSLDNLALYIAPILSARLYKEKQEKERKKLDDALLRSRKELSIRNRIAEIFLTIFSHKMYSEVQEVVEEALESEFSIFGYIEDNDTLIFPSLGKDILKTCTMANKDNIFSLEEIKQTIMGRTIREKKPQVSNVPLTVPKGHLPIERILAVPIVYHDEVIGLLMVANKPKNYTNEDRRMLKNLASHISPILHARLQREKFELIRQKAEFYIADSEAKYRGMFEHMNDGVAAFRTADKGNFVFTDFNKAGEKIDKMKREDVIGKKITDVFPEIEKFGLLDVLRRVYRTGVSESFPDSFYKDDRISGWREYFVYKLHAGEIVAVYRDRTEHKEAEEALIIKDSAIESSLNSIMLMDLDGRVTYANPACLNLVGIQEGDILGKSIVDLLKPREQAVAGLATLQENGFWSGDLFVTRKDHQHIDVHVTANIVFDREGKPICMMGSGIDTTKLKQLQTQLIRSERLAATGQLAASVAHEINSPLQAISVILGTLSKKYKGDEILKGNIHLLLEAFKSIRNTVSNLLDLNRPGVEKAKSVNLNRIIENTLSLLQVFLKRKKIKISLFLSEEIPEIVASPQQLGQVFVNLINNAAEAMTDSSKAKGKAQGMTQGEWLISISTEFKGDRIVLAFQNTGPGIPEEDLVNIFDPFYTRKKEMGMGIGLSICHGIITDHHGTIEAKNIEEGGATFIITLPVI